MDRYFTIMVVPEREKNVRSFRIPRLIFHASLFFVMAFVILLGILSYDYIKILRQVHRNQHLSRENSQLKEQIQIFQKKINSLTDDLRRIDTFEKKLRIITGLDQIQELGSDKDKKSQGESKNTGSPFPKSTYQKASPDNKLIGKESEEQKLFAKLENKKAFKVDKDFIKLKDLYEQKIATNFGLQAGYSYTKEWSELTKQSFALADDFATFDYKFTKMKVFVQDLEVRIHELDQYLLDKDSFLKSLPTLLPARGWITSYYGPRRSHYSGRIKMHEGLDIGAKIGKPIVAPADGIVTFSGKKPGFGWFVQVDHGYGIETIYAHAKKLDVKKGQKIRRGELLASVGNTGYSTGPHVHYEVRINGIPVDPLYFILD